MSRLIPEPALLQHIAVLGKTGSGKTFAAKGSLVEPLLEAGHRVCVIDPTDAWWGLRSSQNGKGVGFKILVLGGDHGDLPLTPNGGAAVARLVVEQGISLVACTKHLMVGERTRWFIDFASVISRLNKSRLHLVIDEAHNFAPQGKVPDPDTGKMLHLANSLASEGRSKRICLTVLTQRPQKLHKDTLTSADTLIAMRVLAPQDRQAVKEWIDGAADQSRGKEVLASLAGLQRGEGWVWYPEGDYLQRVKFPRIKTFDSSAGLGSDNTVTPRAAEIDLSEIQAALADAVKEAEANDPKLLRKKVATLEGEIRELRFGLEDARLALQTMPAKETVKEVPVLTDEERSTLWALSTIATAEPIQNLVIQLTKWSDRAEKILAKADNAIAHRAAPAPKIAPSALVRRTVDAAPRRVPSSPSGASTVPKGAARKILTALAQAGRPLTNRQIGARGVLATAGGTWGEAMALLRREGWIEDRGDAKVITTSGLAALGDYVPLPTGAELRAYWFANLKPPMAARILEWLCSVYPRPASNEEIGHGLGIATSGGTWGEAMAKLRSLELITGSRGTSVASEELFS